MTDRKSHCIRTKKMNPDETPFEDLKVVGFCSHNPEKYPADRQFLACFSNWWEASIKMTIDDTEMTFFCVEQWMMWNKAVVMGDHETAEKILQSRDPREIKKLGREVKNYDDAKWAAVKFEIVKQGVIAKFQQHSELRDILLKTGTKTIAEAAHYDKQWGIGLHRTNPDTQDSTKWQGDNLLGQCLMEAREVIR